MSIDLTRNTHVHMPSTKRCCHVINSKNALKAVPELITNDFYNSN